MSLLRTNEIVTLKFFQAEIGASGKLPLANGRATELSILETEICGQVRGSCTNNEFRKSEGAMKFAIFGVVFAITPSLLGMAWLLWHYAMQEPEK
jgi:hypothetical protein